MIGIPNHQTTCYSNKRTIDMLAHRSFSRLLNKKVKREDLANFLNLLL